MTAPQRWLAALWMFALACLVGIQVGGGFIAVAHVFDQVGTILPDSSAAGAIAEPIFRTVNTTTAIVLALLIACAWPTTTGRLRAAVIVLLGLALLLVLVELVHITPEIHRLRQELGAQFGAVSLAPKDNPLRQLFGMLHGISAVRALVMIGLQIAAFVGYHAAATRPTREGI